MEISVFERGGAEDGLAAERNAEGVQRAARYGRRANPTPRIGDFISSALLRLRKNCGG